MEQAKTLTLDGATHDISSFSQGIQQAIAMYNAFQADLQKEQLAVVKTQSALQSIGAQIGEAVKAELAAKEAKESANDSPTAEAEEVAENEGAPTVQ